jgi:hypothetical protein
MVPSRAPLCHASHASRTVVGFGALRPPLASAERASARRAEVEDLVRRVADELGIPTPPLLGDQVAFPPDTGRVIDALNKVEPEWRKKPLLLPP